MATAPALEPAHVWTADQVAALPAVIPLWPTAGEILGIGRSLAYDLARRGEFPVPVLRVGTQFRVPTAALRELLGVTS